MGVLISLLRFGVYLNNLHGELSRIRNQDEFEQEIGRLGKLRHPNLVTFQGYYWSSTMQLILSEFVPNGNLYNNLHGLDYLGTSTGVGNSELYWSKKALSELKTQSEEGRN